MKCVKEKVERKKVRAERSNRVQRLIEPVKISIIEIGVFVAKNLYWIGPILEYAYKKIKELINKKRTNGKRNSQ